MNALTLPEHRTLTILHNPHKDAHEEVSYWLRAPRMTDDERRRAAETDCLWVVKWEGLNGKRYRVIAPTLGEALAKTMGHE